MEEKHREHVIGWAQVKCRGGRTIQFWHVCFECHEIIEGPIRKSRVPNRDMIPLWSFKTWCDWRGVDQSEAKRTQQWRANYKDYLRSHEWAAKRRERFDMDNGICCECGAPADHVHHVTYERLGDERMQDLLSVCRPCHSKIHGRPV